MTGNELRKWRQYLGLSQDMLAEALGVHQQSVSRWETGARAITAPRALWIEAMLKPLVDKADRRRARERQQQAEAVALCTRNGR